MKIIIYGLNFKPELVGTGKYTGELADFLNQKGHEIRVITAPKYYPDWKAQNNKYYIDKNSKYKIFRCPLFVPKSPNGITRILHLISFSITSLPTLLMQLTWKTDCLILVAPTLFCAPNILFFEFFSTRKFLKIIHVQDFELQAAFNLGILKGELLKTLVSKIELLIFENFNFVGTISKSMRKKLHEKGIKKSNTFYLPNWIDLKSIKQKTINDKFLNKYRNKLKISAETVVIQYSGSMNRKQGLGFLLPVIKYFQNQKNILWLFGGEGPTKKEFIKSTQDCQNIMFLPFQELNALSDWLNTGDIHIIPQDEEIDNLLFPSKLHAILASGNPIVCNVKKESDLGKIVEVAGIRVDPKDQIGFINGLDKLIKDEKLRLDLGYKARQFANKNYNKELILEKFEKFISKSTSKEN